MICPTCESPDPAKHPAVQFGGEVQICSDPFHTNARMLQLMQQAIKPATVDTWTATQGLTKETLRKAMELVRDAPLMPSCGSSKENPHVFHPNQIGRLIPMEEWDSSYFDSTEWAQCANCGMPFPMREET